MIWRLLVCAFFSVIVQFAHAQQPTVAYQVKAAMIYKFLGYATWPDARFSDGQSSYRVYIIGSDEISHELKDIVAQRQIDGHKIEIFNATNANQISDAHLVFVARPMEALLPTLIPYAIKNSYLIVTENEQGLVKGSAINLRMVNNRVGFDVALDTTRDYGVSLSSRLLSVAISVQSERD